MKGYSPSAYALAIFIAFAAVVTALVLAYCGIIEWK